MTERVIRLSLPPPEVRLVAEQTVSRDHHKSLPICHKCPASAIGPDLEHGLVIGLRLSWSFYHQEGVHNS